MSTDTDEFRVSSIINLFITDLLKTTRMQFFITEKKIFCFAFSYIYSTTAIILPLSFSDEVVKSPSMAFLLIGKRSFRTTAGMGRTAQPGRMPGIKSAIFTSLTNQALA